MFSKKAIEVRIIGHVRNEIESGNVEDWGNVQSQILVDEEFEPSLAGIEQFSHIVVVFWMHRVEKYLPKVHPRRRVDIPEQGVFATRSPFRPNPIGISVVQFVSRSGCSLIVSGLDCFNGSPVLDIKPFTPKDRGPSDIRIPRWMEDIRRSVAGT